MKLRNALLVIISAVTILAAVSIARSEPLQTTPAPPAGTIPVTMTTQEASTLHDVLVSIQDGPSPVDSILIGKDTNILDAIVGPFQKGQKVAQRQQLQITLPEGPAKVKALLEIDEPIEKVGNASQTFNLYPVDLSNDEVKALAMSPQGPTRMFALSQILRFLAPLAAKP
jgi:hypothetical protein